MSSKLVGPKDLSDEEYREYQVVGQEQAYRINAPQMLWYREGGSTHRVLDADGVVHCVAFPASLNGIPVVLRWKPKAGVEPVAF
jgi:hypothetical protein